jgi:hypothetical protein
MSDDRFAEVFDWAGLRVADYVHAHYDTTARIIDVGAGRGKYRILLHDYPVVDACEIWEPTVHEERLDQMYRTVFIRDFVDLTATSWWFDGHYDLVIMGDVLEHMSVSDAQLTLTRTAEVNADVLVVVPYDYPQDEEHGNVYQRHIQDDLTPESMVTTYPSLRLIALETRGHRPFKGLYVGSKNV